MLSSGFFGSLSGSVISNVVTTGQMTIPTMKRVGYPPHYAGAVEACASTGGALMPPVMGAVAFIMAEFLERALQHGDASRPSCRRCCTTARCCCRPITTPQGTACKGQPRGGDPAPAAGAEAGLALPLQPRPADLPAAGDEAGGAGPLHRDRRAARHDDRVRRKRFGLAGLRDLAIDATRNIVNIVAILAGIGFIVGSLSYTGVGGAFSRELLQFAGGNIYLLLVLGAITSFILGMGMTASGLLHLPGRSRSDRR